MDSLDNQDNQGDQPQFDDLIPLPEVVNRLRQSGFSADVIAATLNVPVVQVRTILVQHRTLTPEEQDIANATRKLIMHGVQKAMQVLDIGTRAEQMTIVRQTLALAGRTLAKTDETDIVEGKAELRRLYDLMRDGDMEIIETTTLPDADGD